MLNTIIYSSRFCRVKEKKRKRDQAHAGSVVKQSMPEPLIDDIELTPPAIVPIPTIVPTVEVGNMSPIVEYRLALQGLMGGSGQTDDHSGHCSRSGCRFGERVALSRMPALLAPRRIRQFPAAIKVTALYFP